MKKWYLAVMGGALFVFASEAYALDGVVPEIDAGSAVTALGVLSGVIALAAERLRRK
jgi:hypothetical protein